MRSREKIGRYGVLAMLLAMTVAVAVPVFAGNPTPPGPPSSPGSRFTLGDLYLQLTTGANPGPQTGPFMEPAAGPPTSPVPTLTQIMNAAPALDNANGATPSQVLFGKKFWGLQAGGGWGPQTGSMSDNGAVTMTPTTADQAILAGYHNGSGKVVGDAALLAGNIKTGVSIFGVAGSVIGSTGTAVVGNVLAGSTFSNATTAGLTGTMVDRAAAGFTPGLAAQTIAAGYYNGSGSVSGDAALLTGNIRSTVTIFGVAGDANVVNTSSGTATAPDILTGKKAWVSGTEITGIGTGTCAAGVPKTAQKKCYNVSGVEIAGCTGIASDGTPAAGQDGAVQKGVAFPNPRFTKNGNGTVTDNMTGLIWLEDANCATVSPKTWQAAIIAVNALASGACSLTDSSTAGQWRVPNVREQQSLVDYNYFNPFVPNTAGTGQWTSGSPFLNVVSGYYWTSTSVGIPGYAWVVILNYGGVASYVKTNSNYVWPVRGGQ